MNLLTVIYGQALAFFTKVELQSVLWKERNLESLFQLLGKMGS